MFESWSWSLFLPPLVFSPIFDTAENGGECVIPYPTVSKNALAARRYTSGRDHIKGWLP